MHECSVKEIVKDLDENFGPVLRSGKIRKDKCHSRDKWMSYERCVPYETRCVSRLVEMHGMLYCFKYYENDGAP